MANFASMAEMRKKEEEEHKKATQSYVGGEKSGLAVQNPDNLPNGLNQSDDAWSRMQQNNVTSPAPEGSRVITLYRDGFTVDDGPFRPLDDPMNKKFLDDMSRGYVPAELRDGENLVNVAVNDKRNEDYKAPPTPAYVAFSGEGNRLSDGPSSSAGPAVTTAGSVIVDEAKPQTSLQIRFHDGQKKVQKFNEDQTVGDVRSFCSQCIGGQACKLVAGFPPKGFTDDSQTLKGAGLLKQTITVKLA